MSTAKEKIVIGKISGVYGIKGWVKVHSFTEPREGITRYQPWYLKQKGIDNGQWRKVELERGKRHAKTVIAKLSGFDDRNASLLLTGATIGVDPEVLNSSRDGIYYWRDLIGLRVVNQQGIELGIVERLFETGANDVLVVKSDDDKVAERLIPWTLGHAIIEVDLEQGVILVDWHQDWDRE